MADFQISKMQARQLASLIIADIRTYVAEHKEQFEKFVKKEGMTAVEGELKQEPPSI